MTAPGKDNRVLPCRELTREWIPAQREARVIRAADNRCECCGARVPAHGLEIHHLLPGAGPEERDPVDLLLVLCSGCHRSIHRAGIDERIIATLADARPARTRLRIRKILSRSRPYSPPDSGDPAEIYSFALGFGATDLFLNGA